MNIAALSQYTGLPPHDVESLLQLKQLDVYQSPIYQDLIGSLNYEELSDTLQDVRDAYDRRLPELIDYLRNEHGFTGKPMTSTTLSNWVLGFLHHTTHLDKLLSFHTKVPVTILEIGLPKILDILDEVGETSDEWKKAMATLSLPFFAVA